MVYPGNNLFNFELNELYRWIGARQAPLLTYD